MRLKKKLINTFHKKYPKKPIVTFLLLYSILLRARLIVLKQKLKQKLGCSNKGANKKSKKLSKWLQQVIRIFFLDGYHQ